MFVAHKTFGRFCMATTLWFFVFFCLTFVSFLALRLQSCSFHFDHSDLYICIWAHNSQAGKCTYTYFCNHLFSVLQRCWTWYLYHSDNFVLNWSSCFAVVWRWIHDSVNSSDPSPVVLARSQIVCSRMLATAEKRRHASLTVSGVRGFYSLLSNVVSVTGHHPPPAYKAATMIVQLCIHQTVTPLGD